MPFWRTCRFLVALFGVNSYFCFLSIISFMSFHTVRKLIYALLPIGGWVLCIKVCLHTLPLLITICDSDMMVLSCIICLLTICLTKRREGSLWSRLSPAYQLRSWKEGAGPLPVTISNGVGKEYESPGGAPRDSKVMVSLPPLDLKGEGRVRALCQQGLLKYLGLWCKAPASMC